MALNGGYSQLLSPVKSCLNLTCLVLLVMVGILIAHAQGKIF